MKKLFMYLVISLLIIGVLPVQAGNEMIIPVLGNEDQLHSKVQDKVFLNRIKNTADDKIESVIVTLQKPGDWNQTLQQVKSNGKQINANMMQTAKEKVQSIQSRFLETYSISKANEYWIGNAVAIEVPVGLLKKLVNDPRVISLEENKQIQLSPIEESIKVIDLKEETVSVEQAQSQLTWGVEKIRADEVWNDFNIIGKGIRVAVIDTGIEPSHPDLLDKVVGFADFINGAKGAYDDNGHGTHVAGSIAGNGTNGYITGVAPGVELLGAKVLDKEGGGTYTTVASGMQWAVENNADIINMSLGGSRNTLFDSMIQDMVQMGILPVIAAGNEGPNENTIGSPGHHPLALTVGATDNTDNIAEFSSRGPVVLSDGSVIIKPDVVAPGVDIISTWIENGWYAISNGTSMATPHTAGAAALLMEAFPHFSIQDIKNVLYASTVQIGDTQPNSNAGWGRVDVYDAFLKGYENGTVNGTVIDKNNNQPIPHALITIVEKEMRLYSDFNGNFSVSLPEGTYTITVESFLFDKLEQQIKVTKQETVSINLELQPQQAGSLTGRIVDVRNRPIPSVKITLETPLKTLETLTDQNGNFYIPRVPEGNWTLDATSYRIKPVTREVKVIENQTATVDLVAYRIIATEAMVGYLPNLWIPLSSSKTGDLIVAGTTSDPFDSSQPNLFAYSSSGHYIWTGKLGDRINEVAVTPGGERVAVAHYGASVGTFSDDYRLFKGENPKEPIDQIPPAPWTNPVETISGDGLTILDRDGNRLSTVKTTDLSGKFVTSEDGSLILWAGKYLRVWDTNGTLLFEEQLAHPAYGIDISADKSTVATNLMNGEVVVYKIDNNKIKFDSKFRVVAEEDGWPWGISINSDGTLIVTGEYTFDKNQIGHIRAFDRQGNLQWVQNTQWHVNEIKLSGDDNTVVAGSWDGYLYVIDAKSGDLVYKKTLGIPDMYAMSSKVHVNVSHDGSRVAAAYERYNYTFVYDKNGNELFKQYSHIHPVSVTGYENLTRLVIGGPSIIFNGFPGPSEIAILDTPDAAYVDLEDMVLSKNMNLSGQVRYGDYGQDYYFDIDYFKYTKGNSIRWISIAPANENSPFLNQTNGGLQANIEGLGRVRLQLDSKGKPIFLSGDASTLNSGNSRNQATNQYKFNINSTLFNWWIYLDNKTKQELGVFTIMRY